MYKQYSPFMRVWCRQSSEPRTNILVLPELFRFENIGAYFTAQQKPANTNMTNGKCVWTARSPSPPPQPHSGRTEAWPGLFLAGHQTFRWLTLNVPQVLPVDLASCGAPGS